MTNSLHHIFVMTRLTFREARRRRLLWLGFGLGVAFIALFTIGFYFAHQDIQRQAAYRGGEFLIRQFSSSLLLAGMYVISFLIVMVTVLTSVATLSSEIDSNVIHAIAAKPIRRWEIVLGKWIGHAIMLSLYTVFLTLGLLIPTYLISGYMPPNVVPALLILILESLTMLSLTLLGSASLSTLANGVLVFMIYGLAFVGGWVEQIGSVLGSQTARDLGIASSLLMPSEALWRYAASLLQVDSWTSVSPWSIVSQPTPAFLIYSIIYLIALLGAAMWVFGRRDL